MRRGVQRIGKDESARWDSNSAVLFKASEVQILLDFNRGCFWSLLVWRNKKKSLVVPDVMKAVKIVPLEPLSCRVSFACFCFYSAL